MEREMKLIVCNIAVASSHALNYLEEWTGNLTSEAGERIEKSSMSYVFPSFFKNWSSVYTNREVHNNRGNIFCAITRFLNLWLRCHWTIYNSVSTLWTSFMARRQRYVALFILVLQFHFIISPCKRYNNDSIEMYHYLL